MARRESHLDMTNDDLRAARVLTLAVKFFGTSQPIAASTIAAELYPSLEEGSFRRQFLRDRELLATLGIVIREAHDPSKEGCWVIDEDASYAQDMGLSDADARMLYVLCYDMAFDQAFPYRDELRMALAKLSRMYAGITSAHAASGSAAERKTLATLVAALSGRHAIEATYTNAQGIGRQRRLALFGSFGMRDHSYFVAGNVDDKGTLAAEPPRTYRLDRFDRVRMLPHVTYDVPQDFSVADYMRLPFQMGDTLGTARFLVGEEPSSEAQRALSLQGTELVDDKGRRVWEVPYSDMDALACWSIGVGLTPVAPPLLCEAVAQALRTAAGTEAYEPALRDLSDVAVVPHKARVGRSGGASTARQLVALAASLTKEGQVITADDIATNLGVSYDEARHLIALVSLGSGESIDYIPVVLGDDDDEVSLMEGAAMSMRSLRLTRAETFALLTALAELGIDSDDPLVRTLATSYAATSVSAEDIADKLESVRGDRHADTLRLCSQAIIGRRALGFSYHPVGEGSPRRRRVVPQLLRRGEDAWYLEAYDLVRRGQRVFRVDRMSFLELLGACKAADHSSGNRHDAHSVVVRFCDERYLDLFHWEGAQRLVANGEGVVVRLPWYGGSWLARHLAACAGTAKVGDEALAQQVRACAEALC